MTHSNAKLWSLALILLSSIISNGYAQTGEQSCLEWTSDPKGIPDGSWICSLNVTGNLILKSLNSVRIDSMTATNLVSEALGQ